MNSRLQTPFDFLYGSKGFKADSGTKTEYDVLGLKLLNSELLRYRKYPWKCLHDDRTPLSSVLNKCCIIGGSKITRIQAELALSDGFHVLP